jgi:hypothetical protein
MRWADVAALFKFDGSWLDIYGPDNDAATWAQFLRALPGWRWRYRYTQTGDPSELPAGLVQFAEHFARGPLLQIQVGRVALNCHFFAEDQIELDLDPREVEGEADLRELLAFITCLSATLAGPVVLTPENMPSYELVRVDARRGTLRWISAAQPSPREQVFVALLDEGVDVWRPVEAVRLSEDTVRLLEDQPHDSDETWEFLPGEAVRCKQRDLSDGPALVAYARA